MTVQKRDYLTVTLLSAALIGLEVIWTRIFSAEFYYTFAFLTLSLAILGLGLGALSVRLFRLVDKAWIIPICLSLSTFFALIGPPIVLHIGLEFSALFGSWLMPVKFLATLMLLGAPFFTGGIVLSVIFRQRNSEMPRLYMADLFGAGLGILLSILLMNVLGTPLATILMSTPILIVVFLNSRKLQFTLPVVLVIFSVVFISKVDVFLDKPREERAPVIYKKWDAISKIKIFEYDKDYRGINIDNLANSPVYRFDGNWDRPDSLKFEFGIDVSYLIAQNESCTFLSLGAGGGTDVIQALQNGCSEVHAVEVNASINKLMTNGMLADYTGNIYNDPRVHVITEDARAYVRRFDDKFDMIYSLSSNTFASLASGSFALAENYLFTTEAFTDYYNALSENGFMMMEHQFYMPRLASEALIALKGLGLEEPNAHVAFYDLPKMRRNMLLLSKKPLTDEIRQNAFGELTPEVWEHIHLLYPAADSIKDNTINRIVLEGWQDVQADAPIDISPCDDDRPFTAQLGLMKNFSFERLKNLRMAEFRGFPLSKLVVLTIFAITLLLILPLTLLPLIKSEKKLSLPAWFYFFAIGVGFMVIEIVLIHKYAFFIGPSSYTLITILFTLLIASGVGSRYSESFSNVMPFLGILAWIILEIFAFTPLKYALGDLTMLPRIITSAVLIFPLGFFMGMPFPKGAKRVGELIDWGFAVNGAASVLGSVLVIMVGISFGFVWALVVGAGCYLLALLMMLSPKWG
jgi:spermidine synthase